MYNVQSTTFFLRFAENCFYNIKLQKCLLRRCRLSIKLLYKFSNQNGIEDTKIAQPARKLNDGASK